ncbi:hypothetical protein ECED1_0884 [Escherichia coli ED1a]|uniref:Uncharacterized protein n=1 Tax=Escherichia coli O81 (strain ED1a) TaxID=585397 RepID=B7MRX2_ECO81|nr:hypothetical protein ECED1_0884 [Escherichia coli ED1a]
MLWHVLVVLLCRLLTDFFSGALVNFSLKIISDNTVTAADQIQRADGSTEIQHDLMNE